MRGIHIKKIKNIFCRNLRAADDRLDLPGGNGGGNGRNQRYGTVYGRCVERNAFENAQPALLRCVSLFSRCAQSIGVCVSEFVCPAGDVGER
jgi:hypothetical protein